MCSGTFSGNQDVAVGDAPSSLVVGDVDGDGDLDFLTANVGSSPGGVSLRLNNGSGTFSGSQNVAVDDAPYSVALGDVDGDGDLDLLTANIIGNTVSVRLNNGAGTFAGGSTVAVGTTPTSVVLGDVDGDGDLDFVTANRNANTVSVRLNNGAGTFAGGTDPAVGTGPQSVVLGDVDGDGDLDLLTANSNANTVSVRLNNGAGTFAGGSTVAVGTSPTSVVLGDVDGDGDLDLLAANNFVSTVSVRLNNGAGTFAGGTDPAVDTSPQAVVLGDVDGDGDLDLLTANQSANTVSVRLNQAPAPVITAVAVNPGGRGQRITLTGTNLGSATGLTINGANAFANIISNTATSVVVRVPTTATASGTISLTTVGGTATSATFNLMAPPGNALAFDGADDQVVTAATAPAFGTGSFTIEAWVRTGTATTTPFVAVGSVGGNDYWLGMNNLHAVISISGSGVEGTTLINDNRWHHLAGVRSGTQLTIYVDGVAQNTLTNANSASPAAPLGIGFFGGANSNFWPGRLDEVRLWNVAQVPTLASRTTPALGTEPGLVLAYNFDQGTPATASTGNNAGLTTLYDLVSAAPATLTNFALTSGNTTSNWVESYALVVPTATAATVPAANGFTANWTAPATGTVTNYLLDVSTAANFSSAAPGSPFTVAAPTLSKAVTGLAAGTTYYYRVRADKTSVTGQGTPSNGITVATCAPPVAIAQNASVTLDVNGNATVAATAVNNGSTANCGPAAAGALSVSPSTFSCVDAVPATTASALSFSGTNQYVAIPTTATVPVSNSSYTIEAWIKPTSMGVYGIIGWGNYGTTSQVNALRLDPSGVIYNYWWANDLAINVGNISGAWHHVAATFDGTTRRMYFDGVLKGSDTPTGHNVPDASNLRIGSTNVNTAGNPGGTGEYFPGNIDEVRVWSVARTAAQINAAKGVGLPGSTPGLVAYYRMNEGSGLTTADATGAAANLGTLTNGPTWTTDAPAVTNGLPVTLTVTDAGGNTATAPAVVTVSVPATPTTTWNGSLSTSPLACQNWSYGQVPDAATNALIPTGLTLYPTLGTGTLATKDLTINNGGSLTVNGGTTLQVNGNFANNGTATLSGTVAFVGSAATQTLSNGTGFTTVVVNKPSGTVQLAQNLTINSALTLSSGTLTTTGAYQVNLGGSALLSESETSYVIGKAVANRPLAPGTAETFNGLGLTLTPAAGSTAPGATLVTRVTGTALTGAGTSQSIQRYFDIQPATNTGLNVTMAFAYFTHELNGIPAANLALFKSVSGGTPWIPQRGTTAAGNVVTKTVITDFSFWTLGNAANPLPVELTTFTAMAQNHAVRLQWTTASEKNTARFDAERSLDGTAFDRLGTVAAAGSTTTAKEYTWTDAQLPAGTTTLYYRLKQVDLDGTFSYSPVRSVRLREAAEGLALYPNPATARTTLTGTPPGALVQVFDALGRVVTSATADAAGTAALALPAGLATGVYVVRTGTKALRLTVE